MTDRATVSTVNGDGRSEPARWWGYSKEHGWVVLDRTVPCNAPSLKVDLLFLRCRDVTTFSEQRERWIPPAYRFAPNYLLGLAPPDSDAAAAELADLKDRWPEFEREVQLVHGKMVEGREAALAAEEKTRKQAAAEAKKQLAAAKA